MDSIHHDISHLKSELKHAKTPITEKTATYASKLFSLLAQSDLVIQQHGYTRTDLEHLANQVREKASQGIQYSSLRHFCSALYNYVCDKGLQSSTTLLVEALDIERFEELLARLDRTVNNDILCHVSHGEWLLVLLFRTDAERGIAFIHHFFQEHIVCGDSCALTRYGDMREHFKRLCSLEPIERHYSKNHPIFLIKTTDTLDDITKSQSLKLQTAFHDPDLIRSLKGPRHILNNLLKLEDSLIEWTLEHQQEVHDLYTTYGSSDQNPIWHFLRLIRKEVAQQKTLLYPIT